MKQPKSLFLIDDDGDDLELLSEAISAIDKDVVCYESTDSESTLKALKRNSLPVADLIFLDLNMPRVDGRQFLASIKKLPEYQHIPVIIYSTSSLQRDIDETKELGAAYFLTKPASLQELIKRLKFIFSTDWQEQDFHLEHNSY
jgi:CheY-like chemotaxis protein